MPLKENIHAPDALTADHASVFIDYKIMTINLIFPFLHLLQFQSDLKSTLTGRYIPNKIRIRLVK